MRSPDAFDAFYAGSRDRLLLETYALTGDVPAARTAVRDAFAVAWQRWRTVSRLEDQEGWVRPLAHGRAQRRHTARPWHREKGLDDEVRATLEALSTLSTLERKALVLTTLSPLPLDDIARTLGVPRREAERALQSGTSRFSVAREAPSTSVRVLLEQLRGPLEGERWPRASIVRRQGTARRRTHTVVGAGLAVAALLVSGTVVASGGAAPSSLGREATTTAITTRTVDDTGQADAQAAGLQEAALLSDDQLDRYGRRLSWKERSTSTNLDGGGLVVPCQRERFADPAGVGALVRTFDGSRRVTRTTKVERRGKTRTRTRRVDEVASTVTEFVELSSDPRQAERAYATALRWYAECQDPRTQLLATHRVARVGDDAMVLSLRSWAQQPAGISVALARTGQALVTTVVRNSEGAAPDARTAATGLAASVNALCGSPGAGTCAGPPRVASTSPYPVGRPAGLLAAVDLPPVAGAVGPWVGTDPEKARTNFASTRCDNTRFDAKGLQHSLTRTFLFPANTKADTFGLTQTVATMDEQRARTFVAEVRDRIRSCGRANLGTSVDQLVQRSRGQQEITVWELDIEVSDSRSMEFLMAIMRDGRAVSQLGFTPDQGMTMGRADFTAVADRALDRLSDLPSAR
jgi:DNA-directed RNA polymerase specialized sigma24 family protein